MTDPVSPAAARATPPASPPVTPPAASGTSPDWSRQTTDAYRADMRQGRRLDEERADDRLTRTLPAKRLRDLLVDEVLEGRPDAALTGLWLVTVPVGEPLAAEVAAVAIDPEARLLVASGAGQALGRRLVPGWIAHVRARDATDALVVPLQGERLEALLPGLAELASVDGCFPRGLFILVDPVQIGELADADGDPLLRQVIHTRAPEHLVARVVRELDLLPGDDFSDPRQAIRHVDQLARSQAGNTRSLLQDLASPNFARLTRRYWDWKEMDEPGEHAALHSPHLEGDGREAAALFLAAHFTELTPTDFLSMSALLVSASPCRTFASQESQPARVMTDAVLRGAGISFARRADDPRLHAAFDAERSKPRANTIRAAFRSAAPLLRECFTGALRDAGTLGHPSEAVASDYLELEIALLGEGSRELGTVAGRLRSILFGAGRSDDPPSGLTRAIGRAPALVRTVAEQLSVPSATLLDALAASGAADGLLLRNTVAFLAWTFWGERRLSLIDFPVWTAADVEEVDARQQRLQYLAALRGALFVVTHPDAEPGAVSENDTDGGEDWSSGRLLTELAELLPSAPPDGDHVTARLFALCLVDVLAPVRGETWAAADAALAAGPVLDPLVAAAVGERFRSWLGGIAGEGDLWASGWDLYRLADQLLELLVGKSALADFETPFLWAWLGEHGVQGDFAARRLWQGDRGDPTVELTAGDRAFLARITGLLPLVPVLLALHGDDATVPYAVRAQLLTPSDRLDRDGPLLRLRRLIGEAEKLQGEWARLLIRCKIPWNRSQHALADDLLRDRREAVARVRRKLENLQA